MAACGMCHDCIGDVFFYIFQRSVILITKWTSIGIFRYDVEESKYNFLYESKAFIEEFLGGACGRKIATL